MEVAIVRGHRDGHGLLVLLQPRVHVVRQTLEEREVRDRGDQAAGEDDLLAPDPVRERAEDDEERRADEEREPDQRVGRDEFELQVDLQEEQRVELARVPDDALSGGGPEEREKDVLVVRIPEEAVLER